MKNKDQILLEQVYSKILNENKINVLGGKVTLNGDVVPDENSIKANKLTFDQDPEDPRSIISNQVFDVDGRKAALKVEEDRSDDDMWHHYSFIDPTTKEHIANMNWGRDELTYQDVLDYIELGLPAGVLRKSENSPYPTRFNLDSKTLYKFIGGIAEKEGLSLIPRNKNTLGESNETILEAKGKKTKKKTKNKRKSKKNDKGIRWGVGTYFTGGGYNFDDTSGDCSGDGA